MLQLIPQFSPECDDSSGVPMEVPVKAGLAVLQVSNHHSDFDGFSSEYICIYCGCTTRDNNPDYSASCQWFRCYFTTLSASSLNNLTIVSDSGQLKINYIFKILLIWQYSTIIT